MKLWSGLPLWLMAALTLAVLCGCRSNEYYQDQAVQKARSYLLEELEDMPFMDQEYIKFNRPFLLVEQITSGYRTGMAQVCICWMAPGNPEVYMVYGVSGIRMIDWSPQRILRRNFNVSGKEYLSAAGTAADEMLKSMYPLLSTESINHIRFTMPGVWKCSFALNSNPDSKLEGDALKKAEAMPRYVLAWEVTEKGQKYYVCYGGTAKNDQLEGFVKYFSGLYSAPEFQLNITDEKPVIAPYGAVENK